VRYSMSEQKPPEQLTTAIGKGLAQGSLIGVQIGCMAVAVTIGALLVGLWLDGQLHTSPWLTIILLLASMPVSVYLIFRFALRAAHALQARVDKHEEDKPA
jgi:F0F1-type ATP synthase assembly protein I